MVRTVRIAVALIALHCGLLLPARLPAAEAEMPMVRGELSERIQAADLKDLLALARPLLRTATAEPVLINTYASSAKEHPPSLWRAVVFFAPYEVNSTAWRGDSMDCYWESSLYLQSENDRRRVVGEWSVDVSAKAGEYLVLPPADRPLPARPSKDFSQFNCIELHSKLDTAQVVDMIEPARGYSRLLRDGTELPFKDLRIQQVYGGLDEKGDIHGTVDLLPPIHKLLSHSPFHVFMLREGKADWRIKKVDQMIYW